MLMCLWKAKYKNKHSKKIKISITRSYNTIVFSGGGICEKKDQLNFLRILPMGCSQWIVHVNDRVVGIDDQ